MQEMKIRKIVEKWEKENRTSWKYLKRKGLQGAEEFGNCIAINCLGYDTIEQLIKELKEGL